MKLPPMIMRLHIAEQGRKSIRLWLPVFLLWALILILALPLLPVIVVLAALYPFSPLAQKFFQGCPLVWEMLCLLKEMTIDVDREDRKVFIEFK